jgi:exosome complex component RRP4
MEELMKNEREFVVPGEMLVKSVEYLPGRNCFRDGEGLHAKKTGLVHVSGRVISVIPLNGIYMPVRDDMIVGEVLEVQSNGWVILIGAPYQAYLPLSGVRGFIDPVKMDMSKIYEAGDLVYGKVKMVSSTCSVHISMFDRMCRKFSGGRMLHVNPAKVPRIIGKNGSMIDLIKRRTGCRVVVGQNGVVWLEGDTPERENVVIELIQTIQDKSHIEGLTNEIERILGEKGLKDDVRGVMHEEDRWQETGRPESS